MGIMAGLPEDNFAYEIFLELNKWITILE
jgi:hypothetical protein